jgi:hypothetical protein
MQKHILLIIVFAFLLTGCSAEYSAVYQRADAENKWDESASIIVNDSRNEPPLFIVVENKLYLMIRMTKVDWFFRTVITYPSWSKADMRRFIENNGGIKSLVPVDWNDWLPKDYGDECKPGKLQKQELESDSN